MRKQAATCEFQRPNCVAYEWDAEKSRSNIRKHGVNFADAVLALEDDNALTIGDDDSDIRIISARKTTRRERGEVDKAGGGNYQTMINAALREYVQNQTEPIEKILRRVVREELKRVSA